MSTPKRFPDAQTEIDAVDHAERFLGQRQWPVVVALKHPVDFGDEHVTSLTFRRGRMGDLKGVSVDGVPPVDQLLLIASRMCGQPIKVMELLADEDGEEVITLTLGFFARCLGAGRKS